MDNLLLPVYNPEELLTKLCFREVLHARTRRAPAGRCRRSPVALIKTAPADPAAALARTAAAGYTTLYL